MVSVQSRVEAIVLFFVVQGISQALSHTQFNYNHVILIFDQQACRSIYFVKFTSLLSS